MQGVADADFEAAALAYIKKTLVDHQRIIFNGNGYAAEWEVEAARRGLANHKTTAEALRAMVDPKAIELFEEFGVLTEVEQRSRYEIKLEKYAKLLNIESRVMERMTRRTYLPAITRFARETADAATALAGIGAENAPSVALAQKLGEGLMQAALAAEKLLEVHETAEGIADPQAKADYYAEKVVPAMEGLREEIEALEVITSRDVWPVPSSNTMLFYV